MAKYSVGIEIERIGLIFELQIWNKRVGLQFFYR
ncbi:hypothetical protein DSUL_20383 [Desulfovibrionales bacterium]